MSLVLKSFTNNLFIMKSTSLSCDCLIRSTSRPYNKIGIHIVDTSWRITSSDAICPIMFTGLFSGSDSDLPICNFSWFLKKCMIYFLILPIQDLSRTLVHHVHRVDHRGAAASERCTVNWTTCNEHFVIRPNCLTAHR